MPPECSYDRETMLALDQRAFDQDLNGGWRLIARDETCRGVAADLIRDYRLAHNSEAGILYWHEGQLRALTGESRKALALFEKTYRPSDDISGWNQYVDATIAFLEDDEERLQQSRESLARLPRPDGFPTQTPSGRPVSWPPNLRVVDQLIACFGRTYREAYGGCEPP